MKDSVPGLTNVLGNMLRVDLFDQPEANLIGSARLADATLPKAGASQTATGIVRMGIKPK